MKRICAFTLYDTKGASSKYRIIQFKKPLEEVFELDLFPFWKNNYSVKYMRNKRKYAPLIALAYTKSFIERLHQLLFVACKADIVFFQKACIPKSRLNCIKLLKMQGKKIVMDVDDAVYLYKRDQTDRIAAMCDLVICGNDILVEHYSQFCKNCVCVPTVENTTLFEPYYEDTFNNKKIGWIGSSTTIPNLEIVVDAINDVVKRHPEVTFDIISDTALDYTERIDNCRLVKWTEEGYIQDLSKITIGIMPLIDSEFNQGKCGFKLVQCLNMKKPVVASDVGVNREIVSNNGFVANSTDEWASKIEELLFDEEIYRKCESAISQEFFDKYHYVVVSDEIKKLLNQLVS